jgi:putative transposase
VPITRVNQGWSTDMTSIRLQGGVVYVVASLDWFRRDVLSWAMAMTMEVGFCLEALEQAWWVAQPEVFHSDHGAPFTSTELTSR